MPTVGFEFDRSIGASALEVRHAIAEALREMGFEVTIDQLTRLEAKRGNLLGTSLMLKKKMPVLAIFDFSPAAAGCAVRAHLADNITSLVGKTWGVNRQYREIFEEVQRRVDVRLAKLDPAAALSFAAGRFDSRVSEIAILEQSNALSAKVSGGAVELAGKVIDPGKERSPAAWKGVDSVTYRSSAGLAVLTLAETQADLGVAVMVASHPGAMPPNLARDVESLAAAVERQLAAAAGHAVVVDVSDAQKPVVEFLHQQGQIRAELPLRELHTCRTCHLDKITNPEYERIAVRNERIGNVMAGVGATISGKGISPTFVLGQVFKLKKLDPHFVCGRCQGMEADERIVTFCPNCAELTRDVVLRLCPKCGFDFRSKAPSAPFWTAVSAVAVAEVVPVAEPGAVAAGEPGAVAAGEPVPPVAAEPELAATPPSPRVTWSTPDLVPIGRPAAGARGKQCQLCRREFPTLWRVVIATPFGYEERFICGTSVACQMVSQAPAVQV